MLLGSSSVRELQPERPQLSFKYFIARLQIEEKLKRKGPRVLLYYAIIFSFVVTLATYNPISSMEDVHNTLAQRYDVGRLRTMQDAHSVMDYLDFFIGQTYQMASAMVDVNTFDFIDPKRCFADDVTDICQLTYWRMPNTDPSAPNFFNKTKMSSLSDGQVGFSPERPVVFDSKMDYPSRMVVPLAPLVWQTRAKREPCSGFGSIYNDEVLGAGKCPRDGDCPKGTAMSSFRNGQEGRPVYLTYEEEAFFCVKDDAEDEVFLDKSWYPEATLSDLVYGRPTARQAIGGVKVFPKFVSNIAYLQAPTELAIDGLFLYQTDHMWHNTSVSGNPRRMRWIKEYLSTQSQNRRNTFVTLETKTLAAVSIIIIPQGSQVRDIYAIAMANFHFSAFGRISAHMDIKSTAQDRDPKWQVICVVFWFVALIGAIDNFQRHARDWRNPELTASKKILRISDVVLPLAAIVHTVVLFISDIMPPHLEEELRAAFSANSESNYGKVVGNIIDYSNFQSRLHSAGFVICVLFVFQAVLQLELHPKFGLLLNAAANSAGELWHIFLACAPLFLIMSFTAYWMFGTDHESSGFTTFGVALRTTLTYVMPGIPPNFSTQNSTMFMLWGLTSLFVLRLFYLVAIASIVKAFMAAKDAVNDHAMQMDIGRDTIDSLNMQILGLRRRWPTPLHTLNLLWPGLEQRLKDGESGMPNAVTPEEIAELTGLSPNEASCMLQHYASKCVDNKGKSTLLEYISDLQFPTGEYARSGAHSHSNEPPRSSVPGPTAPQPCSQHESLNEGKTSMEQLLVQNRELLAAVASLQDQVVELRDIWHKKESLLTSL